MLVLTMSWQHRSEPYASVKLWESLPATLAENAKPSKRKPTPPPITKQIESAPAQLDLPPPTPAAAAPPPLAELAAPMREEIAQPIPESVNTVPFEPPPSAATISVEEQAAPIPEVDVEGLKRERALALAQMLRNEETARLGQSADQEREARNTEMQQRIEQRERKLAKEFSEIRVAAEQRRHEQQVQAEKEAAARAVTDDYRERIRAKIRQRVILPPDLEGNPEAVYAVSLLPGGTVTEIRLQKTSGVASYDFAVERAIFAAQPLPVPDDPGLFQANFKNLNLTFRPKE